MALKINGTRTSISMPGGRVAALRVTEAEGWKLAERGTRDESWYDTEGSSLYSLPGHASVLIDYINGEAYYIADWTRLI